MMTDEIKFGEVVELENFNDQATALYDIKEGHFSKGADVDPRCEVATEEVEAPDDGLVYELECVLEGLTT